MDLEAGQLLSSSCAMVSALFPFRSCDGLEGWWVGGKQKSWPGLLPSRAAPQAWCDCQLMPCNQTSLSLPVAICVNKDAWHFHRLQKEKVHLRSLGWISVGLLDGI